MLNKLSESELVQAGLWVAAFIGVCILVGLGKLKPDTVELLLMAMIGRASVSRPSLPVVGSLAGQDKGEGV